MWSAHLSDDGPDPDFLRRMSAPDNELPVALPQNAVLARTDDAAIGLTSLQVYTSGVSFQLVVRVRPSVTETVGRNLNELFWEHGPGAARRFLFGVELADGRRAATLPGVGADEQVIFHSGRGGGGEYSIDQSWWLSPVPPAGPVRLVLRCTDIGIEETSFELDGTAIGRAVEDVVTLWPWEPPRDHSPGPPPEPPRDLPADSWFARPS